MNGGRTIALLGLLSIGPAVRPSIAQCPDGSPPPCAARAAATPAPNSVAVLYFDNLSRDSSDAYLADGLTEELIARLGQLERLQVKSRNAVRRYRGAINVDPAAVGRALGVAYLVSGSVRRAGRLRVTVEMVRAATGLHVWGEQYDRADADVLLIEEEVARAVVTAIGGRLAPAERRTLATRPTRNPAAYDHYLQGNFYVAQRQPTAVARAIVEYEHAITLDSTFAAAAAAAAYAYAIWGSWGWEHPTLSRDSLRARVVAWAERALRTNPSSAAAWLARGLLLERADSALAAFDMAVRLDPHDPEALQLRGSLLRALGRDSAAAADYRRALARDPARPITLDHLARLAMVGRRYNEARTLLDSALVVDAGYYAGYLRRAQVWLLLGDLASARRDVETGARLATGDPVRARAVLAQALAASGDTATARALIDRVLAAVPSDSFAARWEDVALALVALGDHEGAIAVMEMVPQRARHRDFAFWTRLPQFDSIRSDPRFQHLVEESRPQ